VLNTLYAAAARRRREWYARNPALRRRLRRPVISVGNLAVGGRGKTPTVACIARLLLEAGERPAVLSRGYGREQVIDGVVIVRDPGGIRADVPRSGDEPLMLARRLPGASVLVCEDRYLAGRLAEHHLGATVHILDDGLQHMQLDRDVEIVIVGREDVERPVTLPFGRLREPLDTIIVADALLVEPGVEIESTSVPARVFRTKRRTGPPVREAGECPDGPIVAVAGIASPPAFFADLEAAGHRLARRMAFPDHHRFSRKDLAAMASEVRETGAACVLTTEKDYVRLLPFRPFPVPIAFVPLTMEPDPLPEFAAWLSERLRETRDIPGE
jgi:tetraacyldisaccharide 4'-kinase